MKPESHQISNVFRLLLMRHAKSDWSIAGQSDHDRSLNSRGQRDAPQIASWILDSHLVPDRVLCSSAVRTRETIAIMNETWESECEISYHESLYLATPETILKSIRDAAGGARTVLVLGHNPGMSYLASQLSNQSIELPTAAIAIFECTIDEWSDLRESTDVRLVKTIRPKAL